WMIAATLNGWADPAILAAYEAERQPITEQVSHFTTNIALKVTTQRREIPAEVEWPGPFGDAMRARIGKEAHDIDIQQHCAAGLDVDSSDAQALYARKLVLIRPDQHVAWRGDEEPAVPMDLIDLLRGARTVPARKAA